MHRDEIFVSRVLAHMGSPLESSARSDLVLLSIAC